MDGVSRPGTIFKRRLDHERSGCVTAYTQVTPKRQNGG
jgi:hypothetical protein